MTAFYKSDSFMFNPPCNTHAEAVNSGIRNRLEGSPGRGKLNVKPIPLTKEKKNLGHIQLSIVPSGVQPQPWR